MEHKRAIEILIKLADNRTINADQKEALMTAVGVLGWTSLAKSRIKTLKEKSDKSRNNLGLIQSNRYNKMRPHFIIPRSKQ